MVSTKQMVELWRVLEMNWLADLEAKCMKMAELEAKREMYIGLDVINALAIETADEFNRRVYNQLKGDVNLLTAALEVIRTRSKSELHISEGFRLKSLVWASIRKNLNELGEGEIEEMEELLIEKDEEDYYMVHVKTRTMGVVLAKIAEKVAAMVHEESEKNQ